MGVRSRSGIALLLVTVMISAPLGGCLFTEEEGEANASSLTVSPEVFEASSTVRNSAWLGPAGSSMKSHTTGGSGSSRFFVRLISRLRDVTVAASSAHPAA